MDLKIKAVSPKIGGEIPYPFYASAGAAAMDLHACLEEPVTIGPGELVSLPTGIAVALPEGTVGLVFGRSGLGIRHGILPSNAVGVIDSDYRGEILVGLRNLSGADYRIEPGERIAQLLVLPVLTPAVEAADELPATARGDGGFGSTGRR